MLFQREAKTRLLDAVVTNETRSVDEKARQNDEKSKSYSKSYQDNKNRAIEKRFAIEDKVLLCTCEKSKMNTSCKPVPYEVVEKKGRMLTVENNGHRVTRNPSQMKKVSDHLSGSKQLIHEENDLMEDEQKLSNSGTGENAIEKQNRPRRDQRPPKYLDDFVWKSKC